jgi:hypothetical protein
MQTTWILRWASLLALVLALPGEASAGSSPPLANDEKRELPSYDGRAEEPLTLGEALLWGPRVLLFPAYALTEWGIRAPVGAVARWVEKDRVVERVSRLVSGDASIALYPTALVDFGLGPSVGFYAVGDGFVTGNDRLGVHGAWGGNDWWRFTMRERVPFAGGARKNLPHDHGEISFHFEFDQRPDHVFHGLGADAGERTGRFLWQQLGGHADVELQFGSHAGVALSAGVRRNRFASGHPDRDDGEVQIAALADERALAGWGGYALALGGAELVLDSRGHGTLPGSGVRLQLDAELAADPGDANIRFGRYGGEAAAFVDLNGRRRVLGLRQRLDVARALGAGAVPFAELPALGGDYLAGFVEGRYRGPAAVVTSLQYTWPVWVWLDGKLFAEAGNTFAADLADYDLRKLAGSFGGGLRTNADRDLAFELLLAGGTSRFDDPSFGVENVRVVVGTTTGF